MFAGVRPEPLTTVDVRRRPDPRVARRRAVTLLLLTAVLPGSAQLVAGRRDLGRIAVRVSGGVAATGVLLGVLALVSRPAALTVLTHRWVLAVAEWVLYGLAALWALLLVDAWRLGRDPEPSPRARRALLVTLVVLLAVPTSVAWAGRAVGQVGDTVGTVFSAGRALEAADGRYNILLLGGDSGANRVGTRPDSIQLASIDADTGRAVLFGFSRETENIEFRPGSVMATLMPEGWTCGDDCLLNGLYTWAHEHADRFPAGTEDPGVLATVEAVEALSGLDVQYHVLVDLKGFSGLVDAVGGLTVNVQRRTPMGGGSSAVSGYLEPGTQTLDGPRALWYARSREGSTNYERMARQRCVVTALLRQLDPPTLVLRL
ncbi:MAG: LCP family protein, partial [Phycicoccus sp.]